MSDTHGTNVRQAAEDLLRSGIVPVPVLRGDKRPAVSQWQELRPTKDDLDDLFPEGEARNIGVLLGEPSGGLVDIDCDCPEAVTAASKILHEASVRSGRGADTASHYWFRVTDGAPPRTQKFTDPVKPGAVLVELRSTGGQTVVPPSIHPDGTPYRWITPITEEGAINTVERAEVERIARLIAAVSVLARYWPQKGSRHNAHLALCGALLRDPDTGALTKDPRWSPEQVEGFARLVVSMGGDTEWWQREDNITTTVRALEKGQPVQGWTTLTQFLPAAAVWQVREWLDLVPTDTGEEEQEEDEFAYEEDPATLDEEWNRVQLGSLMEAGIPEPVELIPGTGLIYKGEVTTIQSAGGSGKTLIACDLIWRAIKRGINTAFIDEENGPAEIGRRMASFGVDTSLIDEHLFYFSIPSINWTDARNPERLVDLCKQHDIQFVVFDSVMDMLSSSGLDENSNSEFGMLYDSTVKRLKTEGVTVLLLDHVSKASAFQARGASAKFDQSSVVWGVKVNQKFDSQTSGSLTMKRRKGRLAAVVSDVLVNVFVTPEGEDAPMSTSISYSPNLTFVEPGEGDDEESVHEQVCAYLLECGALTPEDGRTKTDVADHVTKQRVHVFDYLTNPEWPVRVHEVHSRKHLVWLDR